MEARKLIETVPDEATLEVNVNIGYRATRRKFRRDFMSDLESGLRNMPDGEVRVRSNTGRVIGDEARLHTAMSIDLVRENSSLLDNEHALQQLKEVYRRFLH